MSDLTDNYCYASAERTWLCIRLKNASLSGPAIDIQKMPILSRGIIGPFFFENEQGEAVTVNDDRYRAMLNEFLFTKIEGRYW